MDIREFEEKTRKGFEERVAGDLVWYAVPSFEATGVFGYGFTSRNGGASPGDFSSLNLSRTREANEENKKENYARCARAMGFSPDSMVLVNYEHGDGVCVVGPQDRGKGFDVETDFPKCDALVIEEPGVTAVTLHADCVPVTIADPVRRVGAVAHAGWKGTAKRLPEKLSRRMIREFGCRTEDLLVAVGPHIRECCFEVGRDVSDIFSTEFGPEVIVEGDRPHVRLERAILIQLMEAGIKPEQVTLSGLCTHCREDLFYSHRRDHGSTGAMGSFLYIRQ